MKHYKLLHDFVFLHNGPVIGWIVQFLAGDVILARTKRNGVRVILANNKICVLQPVCDWVDSET